MKLSFDKIKEITKGAARIEQEDKYIRFYRFTKKEEELYKERRECFYEWSKHTAGIKLVFNTDSKKLFISINIPENYIRKFFSLDVLVNGESVGYIDNFSHRTFPDCYTDSAVYEELTSDFRFGDFCKSLELGEGKKTVEIYLPYSVVTRLEELSVDDGAFIEPVKSDKKLLVYGDSITQGFDILRPSCHYVPRLAATIGAEVFNKAIAGEVFWSGLTSVKQDFIPDYITVAYGTNDWSSETEESFNKNCRGFFENLCKNYPSSKIFAFTPLWRRDVDNVTTFGEFKKIEKNIRDNVADFGNVTVISGFDFVPHEEKYFGDSSLHPNDTGFEYFFENLYGIIKNKLEC